MGKIKRAVQKAAAAVSEAVTGEPAATGKPRPKAVLKPEDNRNYCRPCDEYRTKQGITEKLERIEDETGAYHCLRCKSERLIPKAKVKG